MKDYLPLGAKACVFDFDGTLADTEAFHFELYRRLLGDGFGVDLAWEDWLHYIGRTDPDFHRMMEKDYGITIDSEAVMAVYFRALLEEEPAAAAPYGWVREVLTEAREKQIPACILSSGNRDVICACLKAWDLSGFFRDANVISVSSGLFAKGDVFADPARYLDGFSGGPGDVMLFEDSIHTIKTARGCGIGWVAGVTHGYNRGIEAFCDLLLDGSSASTAYTAPSGTRE